jgi:hypothetical protein
MMKIPDYWITSKKEKFLEGNLTGIIIILVARQYVFYSNMILVLVYGISLAEFERQTSWQLVQSKVYLFMRKIGRNIIIPWWKTSFSIWLEMVWDDWIMFLSISLTFFMHLAKGQMSFQHLFASVFGLPIILYLYHILVFSWNTSQTNSTKLGKRESLE